MAINPISVQPEPLSAINPMVQFGTGQSALSQWYANQVAAAQQPYAAQQAQANLQVSQAQAPYLQSMTAMNQASIPWMGYKFMAPYVAANARALSAGTGVVNSYQKLISDPKMAGVLQDNPQLAIALRNAAMSQSGLINNGIATGGVMAPNLANGGYNPQQPIGNGQPSPSAPGSPSLPPPGGNPNMAPSQNMPLPLGANQIQRLQQVFGTQPSQQDVNDVNSINNAAGQQSLRGLSDTQARQKALYATNIDKTLQMINPDDLVQYSGGVGTVQKAGQSVLSSLGQNSQNYKNYLQSLNAADMLATQVRQFYGDSIQPTMIERLQSLTNPESWSKNPELAKSIFNETKQILQNETQTYRDSLQGANVYTNPNPQISPLSNAGAASQGAGQSGSVRVQMPDGKQWNVPASKLSLALSRGGKQL